MRCRALISSPRTTADVVGAGGVLATGTDQSFEPDYLRELDLLRAAGLETWDILRAASTGAAAAIDQSGSVGTLAPGSLADIVLTDDNAVEDLTAVKCYLTGASPIEGVRVAHCLSLAATHRKAAGRRTYRPRSNRWSSTCP